MLKVNQQVRTRSQRPSEVGRFWRNFYALPPAAHLKFDRGGKAPNKGVERVSPSRGCRDQASRTVKNCRLHSILRSLERIEPSAAALNRACVSLSHSSHAIDQRQVTQRRLYSVVRDQHALRRSYGTALPSNEREERKLVVSFFQIYRRGRDDLSGRRRCMCIRLAELLAAPQLCVSENDRRRAALCQYVSSLSEVGEHDFDLLQIAAVAYLRKLDELHEDRDARRAADEALAKCLESRCADATAEQKERQYDRQDL